MSGFKGEVEFVDPLSKIEVIFFVFFFLAAAILVLLSVLVAPTVTVVLAILHDLVFQISPYSRVLSCGIQILLRNLGSQNFSLDSPQFSLNNSTTRTIHFDQRHSASVNPVQ